MSERQKSQKGFVAVTLITILAIALVLIAYATLLGTFHGGEVTVGAVQAEVLYSTDNSTYLDNLYNVTDTWYAMFNVSDTSGYAGPANITFQLQNKTGPGPTDWADWVGQSLSKDVTLTGGWQEIYSQNWGAITPGGAYRIKVTVESTG